MQLSQESNGSLWMAEGTQQNEHKASVSEERLQEFRRKVDGRILEYNRTLDDDLYEVLSDISRTGKVSFAWELVRPLIAVQMVQVFAHFFSKKGFIGPVDQTFESRRDELLQLLLQMEGPPFTIQRLTELLLNPMSQYSATHKVMNAVEKLLRVSSWMTGEVAMEPDEQQEQEQVAMSQDLMGALLTQETNSEPQMDFA